MSEPHADHDATHQIQDGSDEPIRYPTNHVVAVLDSERQLTDTVEGLIGGGFIDTEVHVSCGSDAADRLKESTGRGGLAGLAIRIADRLGIQDEEMEAKAHYEQAMRDGHFVLRVAAPTEERKARAAQILQDHGAHSVKFLGRFSIEGLVPPSAT